MYLGFFMELTRGRFFMYVNPMGIYVVLGILLSVLCDLTSSTHEVKKNQRPKEEHGK